MSKLTENEITEIRKNQLRFEASSKLEGIEYTEKQNAMFDLFEQKGWDSDQCIKFVEAYYGYKKEKSSSLSAISFQRVEDTLKGLISPDDLTSKEQEVFFEMLAESMNETTPEQEAFFANRRKLGLGVGLDEDDNLIYQTLKN